MIQPNTAVSMKFALVLMTLTRTVLLASVSALVKSPHIIALKSKFIAKKNYVESVRYTVFNRSGSNELQSETYASHQSFNDQALFLHPEEIRPLFKLAGCGHLGKNSIK